MTLSDLKVRCDRHFGNWAGGADRSVSSGESVRQSHPSQSPLGRSRITDDMLSRVRELGKIAARLGQSLAQLALAWVLRDPRITSALIGASRPEQVVDYVGGMNGPAIDSEDLAVIGALFPVD